MLFRSIIFLQKGKIVAEGTAAEIVARFEQADLEEVFVKVELVWNGKTNEVCNVVLPFQTIEHVDEPRNEDDTARARRTAEGKEHQQLLFSVDDRGRQLKGWTNKLIWGDNKLILSSLKNGPLREEIEAQGGIKLIYIDPPFDVGADFSMDIAPPSTTRGDDTFLLQFPTKPVIQLTSEV